jgi:hypothetical protein
MLNVLFTLESPTCGTITPVPETGWSSPGELSDARSEEDIARPGGLLAQLTKRLVERAMEAS